MKRKLLNIIFSKYPKLGNFEELINLDEIDLYFIADTDSLQSAKDIFKEILNNKESKNKDSEDKPKSLINQPVFYVNF